MFLFLCLDGLPGLWRTLLQMKCLCWFVKETPAVADLHRGIYHDQNTTKIIQRWGVLHNYTDKANYTEKSEESLGVVVVGGRAGGLEDFGLPDRLILQSLPSAHLTAPSRGNQAPHCCRCCTGSVTSW